MTCRSPRKSACATRHAPSSECRPHIRAKQRARQGAQSSVEYLIVLSLLALALTIGPDSALEQLFRAFDDHYQKFTYAMSRP